MNPRKALVLDHSARHRLRVTAVLDDHPAITVVGAVGTVEDALARAERTLPDLVVLDADFSGETGIATVKKVRKALPDAAVWVLTDQGTARGPMARTAFRLGVQAWLLKPPLGVEDLRGTLYSAAEKLLSGTGTTEDAEPNPPDNAMQPVRPAPRPVLKAVAPGTARVRASAPAPPPDPVHGKPSSSVKRPVLQTPMSVPEKHIRPVGTSPSPKQGVQVPAPTTPSPTAPSPAPARSTRSLGSVEPARSREQATPRRTPIPPRPLPPRPKRKTRTRRAPAPPPPPKLPRPTLIVIGASTGGEEAIALVLEGLPPALDIPVVVIQDMPEFFLARFAERLHAQGPLPTALAVHGAPLLPGRVWVVPGNHHIEIHGAPGAYTAHLRGGRRIHGNRPSMDVALMSLVRPDAGPTEVVILTGTGRDGADGAKALLAHQAHVIAQDKDTSVVWGMPGAVDEDGTAHRTVPLERIAAEIGQRMLAPTTV